jgi:hypothetical protein
VIACSCQAQSNPFVGNTRTENNKNTLHVVSDGNGADALGSQNGVDGSIQVTMRDMPSEGLIKQKKSSQFNEIRQENLMVKQFELCLHAHDDIIVILSFFHHCTHCYD